MFRIFLILMILPLTLSFTPSHPNLPTEDDLASIAAVWDALDTYGNDVWSGWGDHRPAILLWKGDSDYLIGHPDPPDEFERVPDLAVADIPVYRLHGHLTPYPIASTWHVNELWVMAIPAREDFQDAIDMALGEGVFVLDELAYQRAMIHESFHVFQFQTYDDPSLLPGADNDFDLDSWFAEQSAADIAQYTADIVMEGQFLHDALQTDSSVERQTAINTFLEARQQRRSQLPDGFGFAEDVLEWTEGSARYADTRMMMYLDPESDATWDSFLADLDDLSIIPGSYRDWFYMLGATQAFLLDDLSPDWQSDVLIDGRFYTELLAEIPLNMP